MCNDSYSSNTREKMTSYQDLQSDFGNWEARVSDIN